MQYKIEIPDVTIQILDLGFIGIYLLTFGITSGAIKKKILDKSYGNRMTLALLISRTLILALDVATIYCTMNSAIRY